MKNILIIFLLSITLSSSFAQKDSIQKKGYVQVSLFHPIGTGWTKSKFKNYNFSLNLIYGQVGSVSGFELGLVNIARGNVNGFQLGLVNVMKGGMHGFQTGIFTNINKGNSSGVQFSGLWTHNHGKFTGWQFSWFGNTNWDDVYGGQLSHLLNYSHRDMYGLQFALGPNIAKRDAFGIQMSATVNIAGREHKGVQFGFLGNYAYSSSGIQFGAVNVTKKKSGLQIGLINYSGDSTIGTIGLVNIVPKGYNKLELWGGELFSFNASLKTGGRKIYSILSIGGNPFNENKFWAFGWGFGTHMQFTKRFYADIDQTTSLVNINEVFSLGKGKTTLVNQIRFMAGFEITPKVAFFIGPVWNILISDNNSLYDSRTNTNALNGIDLAPTFRTFYGTAGNFKWAMWPGIGGGIRFF